MTSHDKISSGFIITNTAGLILQNSSSIAGVDYDNNNEATADNDDNDEDQYAYHRIDLNDIAENPQPNQLEDPSKEASNQGEIDGEGEINDKDDYFVEETMENNEEQEQLPINEQENDRATITHSERQVKIHIRFCKMNNVFVFFCFSI